MIWLWYQKSICVHLVLGPYRDSPTALACRVLCFVYKRAGPLHFQTFFLLWTVFSVVYKFLIFIFHLIAVVFLSSLTLHVLLALPCPLKPQRQTTKIVYFNPVSSFGIHIFSFLVSCTFILLTSFVAVSSCIDWAYIISSCMSTMSPFRWRTMSWLCKWSVTRLIAIRLLWFPDSPRIMISGITLLSSSGCLMIYGNHDKYRLIFSLYQSYVDPSFSPSPKHWTLITVAEIHVNWEFRPRVAHLQCFWRRPVRRTPRFSKGSSAIDVLSAFQPGHATVFYVWFLFS